MRLNEELRDRTKRFASSIVRLYVALPRQRKNVKVLGTGCCDPAPRWRLIFAKHPERVLMLCSKLNGALQGAGLPFSVF